MAAWKKWLSSQSGELAEPDGMELNDVRAAVLATLRDCDGAACERMRWRLQAAQTAQDMWLLRSEIFQMVSAQHCQAVAASRINALLPAFEQHLPTRMLTKI
jgi:hypothetical protein